MYRPQRDRMRRLIKLAEHCVPALVSSNDGTVARRVSTDYDLVVRARVAGLIGWTIR